MPMVTHIIQQNFKIMPFNLKKKKQDIAYLVIGSSSSACALTVLSSAEEEKNMGESGRWGWEGWVFQFPEFFHPNLSRSGWLEPLTFQ